MRRKGFTLVELIVVMSIIAVLVSLTIAVVGRYITAARESATETNIRKVHALMRDRDEALHRLMVRPGFVDTSRELSLIKQAALTTNVNAQRVLAKKVLLRRYFPQTLAEIIAVQNYVDPGIMLPQPGGGWSADCSILQNPGSRQIVHPNILRAFFCPPASLPPGMLPVTHVNSSEILFDALTQFNTLGSMPEGTDNFGPNEVGDPDKDGLREFIDAWGNPLRFYRWPTRLFRPAGYGTNAAVNPIDPTGAKLLLSTLPNFSGNALTDLARDPDDPLRLCANVFCNVPMTVDGDGFEAIGFHTPATFHAMLIVSAGQDGVLGLYEPDDVANFGHLGAVRDLNALADDITYLNVRAGGR